MHTNVNQPGPKIKPVYGRAATSEYETKTFCPVQNLEERPLWRSVARAEPDRNRVASHPDRI